MWIVLKGEELLMQLAQAAALRRDWEAKGNPPCEHPGVEKEYQLVADTGDEVCTTCGACGPRGSLQRGK